MIFLFIILQFILCALYDVWQMAKAELIYWEALNNASPEALKLKQQASNNTSLGQFAFWYSEIFVSIFAFWGFSWIASIILALILFLHYSGLEDWLYFVFSSFIKLPDSWWASRKTVKILFWKFPEQLPWLAVTRLGFIHSYWIPLWAGSQVDAKRFTVCVAVSLLIVSIILWII